MTVYISMNREFSLISSEAGEKRRLLHQESVPRLSSWLSNVYIVAVVTFYLGNFFRLLGIRYIPSFVAALALFAFLVYLVTNPIVRLSKILMLKLVSILTMCLLSLLNGAQNTTNLPRSLELMLSFGLHMGLFVLGATALGGNSYIRIARAVAWAGMPIALYSVFQFFTGYVPPHIFCSINYVADFIRPPGGLSDPNYFAAIMLLALWCSILSSAELTQKLYFVLAIFEGLVVLMTLSRGALITLVATIVLWYLICLASKGYLNLKAKVILVGVLAIVVVAFTTWQFGLWEAFVIRGERLSDITSIYLRVDQFRVALSMMGAKPLFGVGPGNFESFYQEFRPRYSALDAIVPIPPKIEPLLHPNDIHNTYLKIFAEIGIIAGILWLSFIWYFVVRWWKLRRRVDTYTFATLGSILWSQLIAGMFIHLESSVSLWVSFILIYTAYRQSKREKPRLRKKSL